MSPALAGRFLIMEPSGKPYPLVQQLSLGVYELLCLWGQESQSSPIQSLSCCVCLKWKGRRTMCGEQLVQGLRSKVPPHAVPSWLLPTLTSSAPTSPSVFLESPLSLEFLLLFLESGWLHFFFPYPPLWVSEYLMVVNESIFTTSPETSVFGVTDQRTYYWHKRKPANWPFPHRRQVLFSSCLRFWLAVWPLFPHPVIVSALQECCGVQQMLRTVPLKGGKIGVRCAIPGSSKRVRVI